MTDNDKKNGEKADNKKIETTDKPEEQTKETTKQKDGDKLSDENKDKKSNKKDEKVEVIPENKKEEQPVIKSSEKKIEDITETIDERDPENSEKGVDKKPQKPEKIEKISDQKKKPSDKKSKKKEDKDEDFQYIVRIANTDIDGDKTVVMGISQIKGIGRHMATLIADATGIDKKLKMGKLSEGQIEKIREVLDNISNIAPGWMLNHRKDIDTGKDIHLISSEVDLRLRDDVNLLKMIRSYRGIRHESGLSVRGQRTRANNRRGLSLGVSKKRT